MRSCGRNPSIEEFKELCTLVDTKLVRHHFAWSPSLAKCMLLMCCCIAVLRFQDGALDFEDFMCLYVTQLKDGPNNENEMIEAFQAFDKAGNGFIMVDDLKQVRQNACSTLSRCAALFC